MLRSMMGNDADAIEIRTDDDDRATLAYATGQPRRQRRRMRHFRQRQDITKDDSPDARQQLAAIRLAQLERKTAHSGTGETH